jgi:uncharacterized membrane protein YcaP (DUF421 family)
VLFNGWAAVLRIIIVSAATYIIAVGSLRIVGQRALAKMSAYDAIVTVAIGSLVAAIPLTKNVSIIDGAAAIVTYLGLQELTRFLQVHFRRAHHIVRSRPDLLVWEGEILEDRLRGERISPDEIRAAVRRSGFLSLDQVQAVVLENDGEWSVVPRDDVRNLSALAGLIIPPDKEVTAEGGTKRLRGDAREERSEESRA